MHSMKRSAQLAVAVAFVLLFCGAMRTWKYANGKTEFKAEFVGTKEDGRILLKRAKDGKTIPYSIRTFSRFDQIWVEKELQRREDGDTGKPTTGDKPSTGDEPVTPAGKGDWPQWRGPNRDGISPVRGLMKRWPSGGPQRVWTATGLGKGYASVAVVNGKVYTVGKRGSSEYLICLDDTDGKQAWVCEVGKGDHSNGTPTVDGDRVYCIGLAGDLLCADAESGREIWRRNFGKDYGGKMMSQWGFSESPLVDGDKLVCTPGGPRALIVALNKRTGKGIWATPLSGGSSKGKDGAGYSSIVISEAGGVKQYVQLVGRGVVGVSATSGKLLWGYNKIANTTANIPTPICRGQYVFCSSGYEGGTAMLKISKSRSGVKAEEVFYLPANKLLNHHGGMVLIGRHVYMGHGNNNGFLTCIDALTGKIAWGPLRGPGSNSAAITAADGHLYVRYENGLMALVEATPDEFRSKGSFRIASVLDKSWPHPAIANGRLYLRDQDRLHCYDIRAR